MINVAFADDNEMMRKGVIALLQNKGFNFFLEATDGRDFLAKLNASDIHPDVCLIDISMPNMGGFELISELKKQGEFRLLVLTAHKTEYNILKIVQSGANGYVLKSSSPTILEHAIKSVYENGLHFPEIDREGYIRAIQSGKKKIPELTEREIEVLKFLATGKKYEAIASEIGTTRRSIDGIKDRLFSKFNVDNRSELVIVAINSGLIVQ